jgi:hypothetical protein
MALAKEDVKAQPQHVAGTRCDGKESERTVECAGMTALWNDATCRVGGKRRHVAALQKITLNGLNYFKNEVLNHGWAEMGTATRHPSHLDPGVDHRPSRWK